LSWPVAELPADLRAAMRRAGNGEPAFRPGHALEVVAWLLDRGRPVLGGEIYEQVGDVEWGTYRTAWETTPPRRPGEGWDVYGARACEQARDAIAPWRAVAGVRVYVAPG